MTTDLIHKELSEAIIGAAKTLRRFTRLTDAHSKSLKLGLCKERRNLCLYYWSPDYWLRADNV